MVKKVCINGRRYTKKVKGKMMDCETRGGHEDRKDRKKQRRIE
jgi:hypothetical protein